VDIHVADMAYQVTVKYAFTVLHIELDIGRLSLLTNSVLVYAPKCGGGWLADTEVRGGRGEGQQEPLPFGIKLIPQNPAIKTRVKFSLPFLVDYCRQETGC
jgi:hypothetical protein